MNEEENRFAQQHQLRVTRAMMGADGIEKLVTVNDAESPLGRLWHRKVIDAAQFDAGERLRRDFTLAGLAPRMGVDLTQPLLPGGRGQKARRR